MNFSFNKDFYKNPLFYLFFFNLILFLKQGLFQRSKWLTLLAIFLLLFQLLIALTEQTAEQKRSKWLILILLLLSLCLLFQGCASKKERSSDSPPPIGSSLTNTEEDSIKQYQSIVSNYTPLTIDELVNDAFSKNSLLFLGRASCPYCRDFVPLFHENMQKLAIVSKVYYCNVEEITEDEKKQLLAKYPIVGVPTLIYLKDNGTYNILDESETSLPEWLTALPKKK
ncbi:thioredoxin family protein [Streptococcus merionis]|uniref:thioredoxin family protein n=1 Tax=Streptococcus merionis TaxID=400065 RepID=UPI003518CC6B